MDPISAALIAIFGVLIALLAGLWLLVILARSIAKEAGWHK